MNYFINLRRFVLPGFALCSAICLMFAASSVFAQTALTGGLRGNVTDATGAAIPGAVVKIENKSLSVRQEVTTDADGRFVFLGLTPAADYNLQAAASGFRASAQNGIAIVSGETNAADMKLEVADVGATVTVTGDEQAQLAQSPEVSQVISERQLREIPLQSRNVSRTALLDPQVRTINSLGAEGFRSTRIAINGRSFRETHYKLDGSTNFDALYNNAPLQGVALSGIQEFKVLTNQYSAEHGGTSGGFVVTTTKSGTNEFHGEGFIFARPSGIQARPPLADRRVPNQYLQGGGAIGGPIVREKTFFFANFERTTQDRGAFVDRPVPVIFDATLRENIGLVKIDHRFSDTHTAAFRINGNYGTTTNPNDTVTFLSQSTQPVQPSTAQKSLLQAVGVQVSDTIVRGKFVNELRVSYVNAIPSSTTPVTPGVVVIRNGISTEGSASFSTVRLLNYQAAEQVSYQTGKHSFRFGGDFARQILHDVTYDQFGTYVFNVNGTPAQFRQRLGIADLRYGQTRVNGFVQDDWRVSQRLTLNLGLRYDYQSIIKDYNNFGPRLGFALDVKGDGNTVVRGGAGVYYDQPFLHGFTQLHFLNAPRGLTGTITLAPGDPNFPTFPNSFNPNTPFPANLRRNLIVRGDDIVNPYSIQFSLGVQRKIFGDFIATADYIHAQSVKQILVYNLNPVSPFPRTAPGQFRLATRPTCQQNPSACQLPFGSFANETRPLNTFGGTLVNDVLQSVNGGTASYNALNLGVSKRFANRFSFDAHYVFSSATDSITEDGGSARPNEFSDVVRAERAPSDFNQRHRFTAYGTVELPFRSQFSVNALLASGLRVNALTGIDNNGDGYFADRPAGFSRNAFEGSGHKRIDAALSKFVAVSETARLELRVDVFNLFNNSNFYRFDNNYGNEATPRARFLKPVAGISNVDPGRQIQFAARFVF